MGIRSKEGYLASLGRMRPNIYKFGELVRDPATHPATRDTVAGVAELYRLESDPEHRDLLTVPADPAPGGPSAPGAGLPGPAGGEAVGAVAGERISRYLSLMRSADDLAANTRLKRLAFQRTGTCTGGRCPGWSCLCAMWATTFETDRACGTSYHARLRDWLTWAQGEDLAVCGAITDPKGDRTRPPSGQDDPDLNLRVVEVRRDGIVVRGAKVMIAGVASAHEMFVLPGAGYKEPDADYAVSFVLPRDAEGVTIVEARRPSDTRTVEEGFDKGNQCGGISQGYIFFDDVFVPAERVFLCREHAFSGPAIWRFVLYERSTMGGCVAGQGDVKVAAAALMAEANGLGFRPLADKFAEMVVDNETLYGVGLAAGYLGRPHESGVFLPDPLLSNVSKVNVARLPYETSLLCQDVAGGVGETGCVPSSADLAHPELGKLVRKYLRAAWQAEDRMRAARLVEYTTIGGGVPGCMHGGGSPDAAKLGLRSLIDWSWYLRLGRRLAGIPERPEPARK